MSKAKNAVVTTGTAADFFKRSAERAAKLDRGERLPTEIRITFEDPADLMCALSTERVRILQTIRNKHTATPTVSYLALLLKRDRKSVSRDVTLLESLGLLRTRNQSNPGHGVVKVVEPLAEKYHLTATI